MDQTDIALIRQLALSSDRSTAELAASINLSVPAVNKRLARLRNSGVIRSAIVTDPAAVGKPIMAFVFVVLEHFSHADSLLEYAEEDDDVLECYAVTGEYDYVLKICASSIKALENKLLHLKRSRGIAKSHTQLALMEHKFSPGALPDALTSGKE